MSHPSMGSILTPTFPLFLPGGDHLNHHPRPLPSALGFRFPRLGSGQGTATAGYLLPRPSGPRPGSPAPSPSRSPLRSAAAPLASAVEVSARL